MEENSRTRACLRWTIEELNAYHEAGHAFVAIQCGAIVERMTIDPDWDDGPRRYADVEISWPLQKFSEKELAEAMARVALAGPVAEMIHSEEPFHPGMVPEWASDWKQAWEAATPLTRDDLQRLRFLEHLAKQLHKNLFRNHCWNAIACLADELLAHETLERDEILEIVHDALGM